MNEIVKLNDYIGQEQIKKRISVAITSSLLRNTAFPHTLMSGPPGLGKTTLAKIISQECGCPFYGYLATNLDEGKQVEAIFSKLSKRGYDLKTGKVTDRGEILPSIIFIDEIHNLTKKTTEMLHTALENQTLMIKRKNFISGLVEPMLCWIPEFCLIGATNYLGSLPKPFRDRFQISISFEVYTDEEIMKVVSSLADKRKIKLGKGVSNEIAKKSRGIPRVAISFLNKSYDVSVSLGNEKTSAISLKDVEYMFDCEEIDEIGLTRLDRKALNYLATSQRPIGIRALAQAIDEDNQTIENVVEPYLVRLGFIARTSSGRYLTDEGKNHIKRERQQTLYPLEET
jgi:Holliday junction DNA helicase RuvB